MPDGLHPLLVRHLRRAGLDHDATDADSPWRALLASVDRAYRDFDRTHYLSERAAELSSRELGELNRALREQRDRLAREMAIAEHLQTSILPRETDTAAFEIAALMQPATEVGGDYYDVLPDGPDCWIGIGDVSGHGHRAAVIMTMVQSMVAALVRARPTASPRELVVLLNQCLHENVARRLGFDDFVTLTLLHCRGDGRVTYAGAHEDLVVYRRATDACEVLPTRGAWLGPRPDVAGFTVDDELALGPGDLLALYTDGLTEARGRHGEQYGLERLQVGLRARAAAPLAAIGRAVIAEVTDWTGRQDDDITVVLVRARATTA